MKRNAPELPLGWNDPELRRIWVEDALAERDLEKLLEGLRYYLKTHRARADGTVEEYGRVLRDLFTYLWYDLGREGLALEREDLAGWFRDLETKGPHFQHAGRPRRPLKPGSLRRYLAGLREVRAFLDWAGAPLPPQLASPAVRDGRRLRVVGEAEYRALQEAARRRPEPGATLDLALLAMLAEEGWPLKALAWMRAGDYRGGGRLQRRVAPYVLSPTPVELVDEARAALEAWLEAREGLTTSGELPPNVWLSPRRRTPLDDGALRWRLRDRALEAGVEVRDLVRGLRNRAAVRLERRLGSAAAVAERLGLVLPPDVLRKRKQTVEGAL